MLFRSKAASCLQLFDPTRAAYILGLRIPFPEEEERAASNIKPGAGVVIVKSEGKIVGAGTFSERRSSRFTVLDGIIFSGNYAVPVNFGEFSGDASRRILAKGEFNMTCEMRQTAEERIRKGGRP